MEAGKIALCSRSQNSCRNSGRGSLLGKQKKAGVEISRAKSLSLLVVVMVGVKKNRVRRNRGILIVIDCCVVVGHTNRGGKHILVIAQVGFVFAAHHKHQP